METDDRTRSDAKGNMSQQLGVALATNTSSIPDTALSPLVAKACSLRSEIQCLKETNSLVVRANLLKQDLEALKSEALTAHKPPRRDVESFKVLHLKTEALGAKADPLCKSLTVLHKDMTHLATRRTQDSPATAEDWTAKAFDGLRRAYADAVAAQKHVELLILQIYRVWENKMLALAAIKAQKQYDKLVEGGRRRRWILTRLPLPAPNERLVAVVAMGLGREDYSEDAPPVAIGPDFTDFQGRSETVQTYFCDGRGFWSGSWVGWEDVSLA